MAIRFVLHVLLLLTLTKSLAVAAGSLAKPGCQETCGNISIPYPFGIGPGCYIDKGFAVTCNSSFNPPKPFLTSINLELLEVSFEFTNVKVKHPVIVSNCQNGTNVNGSVDLVGSPFSFSGYNMLVAVGCDSIVLFKKQDEVIGGCAIAFCDENVTNTNGSCFGVNCCSTTTRGYPEFINATLQIDPQKNKTGCSSAFMVDEDYWFSSTNPSDLLNMEYAPAWLDWGISNGTCDGRHSITDIICSTDAYCSENIGGRYECRCNIYNDKGNPYLPKGCQAFQVRESSRDKVIILGTISGSGLLMFALFGGWWLHKVVKRRKLRMLKQKFFKRLLQQQLSFIEGNVERAKLFTSKELEKATDRYNENRILGQGGQGTVYKGMLIDGRIVAVKKSKIVDEGNLKQFINEVVILSQINHRNVVKLLGCCLETEITLLVYEFIPNGTLSHYIHDEYQNEDFSLTWDMRLRIAVESADALFYLHSAASVPIYHRDVKSTNILLDDKYRAKISDFGISRSLAADQTHLTTRVLGTFGYFDPEYFQSSQFTEKSDVYSFGVVLVELLTGEKAIFSIRSQEERSLATHFLLAMKDNRFFEILDPRISKECRKEEIMAVAMVAKRCLNLNGKKRPTMKEVSIELEGIRMSGGASIIQQNSEEYEYPTAEITGAYLNATSTSTSTSIASCLDSSASVSLDVQPFLLTNDTH